MIYGNRQTLQEKSTVYKNMMHLFLEKNTVKVLTCVGKLKIHKADEK